MGLPSFLTPPSLPPFLLPSILVFETDSHSAAQAAVQVHDLGSLQPPLPSSSYSPASASWVAEITAPPHLANFAFLVEMGFHHVGQAGLECLTSGDPPALTSHSAGITGVSCHIQPVSVFNYELFKGSFFYLCFILFLMVSHEVPWVLNKCFFILNE